MVEMRSLRVAQITFHNAMNCGAVLQALALQTVLERSGHQVFLPDCNTVGEYKGHFYRGKIAYSTFKEWIRGVVWYFASGLLSFGFDDLLVHRFNVFKSRFLHMDEVKVGDVVEKADVALFGSDQVWNAELTNEFTPYFRGRPFRGKIPMVAYGASVGDSDVVAKDIMEDAACFMAVSWREPVIPGAPVVLDPTLLLTQADYQAIEYERRLVEERYLLFFSLNGNIEQLKIARSMAQILRLRCVVVNMAQKGLWRWSTDVVFAVSPDRLLAYIRDADFVVTDSFHGSAISVVYKKNFLAFAKRKPNGRIYSLMEQLGLVDRVFEGCEDAGSAIDVLSREIPACVWDRLNALRAKSLAWLETALSRI